MTDRKASRTRETLETRIEVAVNLDGAGTADVATGLPFFEHMLDQVARHGRIDLEVAARGDLDVDAHHTVEDVGITLGPGHRRGGGRTNAASSATATPTSPWTKRSLGSLSIFSGRPGLEYNVAFSRARVGTFDVDLLHEFFRGFVNHAQVTLHVDNLKGSNAHHQAETIFKAFGRALRWHGAATGPSDRGHAVHEGFALSRSGHPVLLIPAIDLKDGQCVQLRQGIMESATVYSADPGAMARHWVEAGARRLHVVDLDGAFAGRPVNRGRGASHRRDRRHGTCAGRGRHTRSGNGAKLSRCRREPGHYRDLGDRESGFLGHACGCVPSASCARPGCP